MAKIVRRLPEAVRHYDWKWHAGVNGKCTPRDPESAAIIIFYCNNKLRSIVFKIYFYTHFRKNVPPASCTDNDILADAVPESDRFLSQEP